MNTKELRDTIFWPVKFWKILGFNTVTEFAANIILEWSYVQYLAPNNAIKILKICLKGRITKVAYKSVFFRQYTSLGFKNGRSKDEEVMLCYWISRILKLFSE